MALTKATYSMVEGAPANVLDFGAVADGSADCSAAFAAALAASDHVVVPEGSFRCDTMVEITTGKAVQLLSGAEVFRPAAAVSVDPVFWLKNDKAALYGAGQTNSVVRTEKRSANGVVLVGHFSMTASHANVLYCSVRDLEIRGSTTYGQIAGDPDVCLLLQNPQIGGFASYFHDIRVLLLSSANYGLWLRGWANANTVSHIQGYLLGNTTLGTDKNAFIFCQGALDNAFSDVFFHFSPDSIGLLVDEVDNTGNGSPQIFTPYANSFKGMVFEQNGSNAVGLKALAGTGSFYETRSNCNQGDVTYAGFFDANIFFPINGSNYTIATDAKQRINRNQSGNPIGFERYISYAALTENTSYKIVDVPLAAHGGATVEIDFFGIGSGAIEYQSAGKVVYQMTRTSGGTTTSAAVLSRYTGDITPCVPIVAGGTVSIVFRVENNGTATSGFGLGVDIKVTSLGSFNSDPTFYTTNTVYGPGGTPLAPNI